MSAERNLKELWNKASTNDIPDMKDLLKKAAKLRKTFRLKLILQTIVLIASVIVMFRATLMVVNPHATTIIGLILMVAGIMAYLTTTNQLLPMLLKRDIDNSSLEYLNQLIRIKRKNEFMYRVMIDVYFCLLTIGLWLYILQSAMMISTVYAILLYLIPSACLAIAWICSKRWEFKKTSYLNNTIQKLEAVNAQLAHNEI